jgi:preprotein translocase subunit YajC
MAENASGGLLNMLLLFVAMGLLMYALLIRPQQRRDKEHRDMLARVEKGDQIVTTGGIHGKVTGISDDVLTVEIAPNVRIKLTRSSVGSRKPGEASSAS